MKSMYFKNKMAICLLLISFFYSCNKETVSVNEQYKGVKSLNDFTEILNSQEYLITTKSLSDYTIQSLESSIVFGNDGVFHGFTDSGNLEKELSAEEFQKFFDLMSGTSAQLYDFQYNYDYPKLVRKDGVIIHGNHTWNQSSENCEYQRNSICVEIIW